MNDLETQLQAALHRESDRVAPDELASLDVIRARARTARARRRAVVVSLTTVLVVVMGAFATTQLDSPDRVDTGPVATGTSTTSTTSSTVVTSPGTDYSTVLWPEPSEPGIDDPRQAAIGFFDHWFGGANQLSQFRAAGPDRGEVDVFGVGEDGRRLDRIMSTIHLQRLPRGWFITSATTEDIVVSSPVVGATVHSPLTVEGRGRGFEAHIAASLYNRFDNSRENPLATDFTLGGCCESLEPFATTLSFDGADPDVGGILIVNNGSGLADVASFLAIPVRFGTTASTEIKVFFHEHDGELIAFTRSVPKTTAVLTAALTELVKGPSTNERNDDVSSFFSAETAELFDGVTINDGVADVRFDPRLPEVINNASSSAGSQALIEQLNATVFQFDTVESVRYLLGDSCEAFGTWLQTGACLQFDHP